MRKVTCWLFSLLLCGSLAGQEIVVASYNVENYLLDRCRQQDGSLSKTLRNPSKRLQPSLKFSARLQPDIVGLIEIGDESMLADLQTAVKRRPGSTIPIASGSRERMSMRHICLLSKFPIVERNSRDDVRLELDGKTLRMNRGILDVTVEVNSDYRLRLVGAHLKSRRVVPEYDQALMRAKEARSFARTSSIEILAAAPNANLLLVRRSE